MKFNPNVAAFFAVAVLSTSSMAEDDRYACMRQINPINSFQEMITGADIDRFLPTIEALEAWKQAWGIDTVEGIPQFRMWGEHELVLDSSYPYPGPFSVKINYLKALGYDSFSLKEERHESYSRSYLIVSKAGKKLNLGKYADRWTFVKDFANAAQTEFDHDKMELEAKLLNAKAQDPHGNLPVFEALNGEIHGLNCREKDLNRLSQFLETFLGPEGALNRVEKKYHELLIQKAAQQKLIPGKSDSLPMLGKESPFSGQ